MKKPENLMPGAKTWPLEPGELSKKLISSLSSSDCVANMAAQIFFARFRGQKRRTKSPAWVNSELKKLYLWLASNKLTLNTKKTNFVIFHPYQKSVDYLPQLKIFDTDTNQYVSLEMKNYVKYLGILIDKNLSWKIHIDNVATKLSKTVGLIAKLRHFVSQHTLLNIYHALILPYLSYGLIVWGQGQKHF